MSPYLDKIWVLKYIIGLYFHSGLVSLEIFLVYIK